MYTKIRLLLKL